MGAQEDARAVIVLPKDVSGEGDCLRVLYGRDMAEDEQLVECHERVRCAVDAVGKMGEVDAVAVNVELYEDAEIGVRLDALVVGVKDKVAERVEDQLVSDALIVLRHVRVVSDDGVHPLFSPDEIGPSTLATTWSLSFKKARMAEESRSSLSARPVK